MSKQLQVGQTARGFLALYDDVTGDQIKANFTDESATSSDESIATCILSDDPSFMNFNGIAQGAATIRVTGTAHYTNSAGANVAQQKSADVIVEVFAPSNNTSMRINFPD